MSISGVDSYTNSGMSPYMMFKMRESREGGDRDGFVGAISGKKDGEKNGLARIKEAGMGKDMFASVDTDGDGRNSEDVLGDVAKRHAEKAFMGELSMMMQGGGKGLKQYANHDTNAESLVDALDLDDDSLINLEESGLSEELFQVLDVDGDGKISGQELKESMGEIAGLQNPSGSGGGKGSSDKEEEFDEYDLNKDGIVSEAEIKEAAGQGSQSVEGLFSANGARVREMRENGPSLNDFGGQQSAMTQRAMRGYHNQMSEQYIGSQSAMI